MEMFDRKQQQVEAPANFARYRYGYARPYEHDVKFPDPPFNIRGTKRTKC